MVESKVEKGMVNICNKCNRRIKKCSNLNCSKEFYYDEIIHCQFRKHYCYNCGK